MCSTLHMSQKWVRLGIGLFDVQKSILTLHKKKPQLFDVGYWESH